MDWKVLISTHWGKEPQPESCQDSGHSGEAAAAQGKGPAGRVQGCILGPEEQGQAPALPFPCWVAQGKAGGPPNPHFPHL